MVAKLYCNLHYNTQRRRREIGDALLGLLPLHNLLNNDVNDNDDNDEVDNYEVQPRQRGL